MALTMFGGPLSRKVPETRTFTVEGPAHSLLLEPFTRRVRAEVDGVTVLDTVRGALLFETGLPPRWYLDPTAVGWPLLTPSDTVTRCPYKGVTTGWWSTADLADVAWSYDAPTAALGAIAGLVAFDDGRVVVEVDP